MLERPCYFTVGAAILALSLMWDHGAHASPRVELELITEIGFPPTGSQRWMAALKDAGFSSIRIRQARSGERPEVRQRGSESSPTYTVIGMLTVDNTLVLPGGRFRSSDKTGIKQWLAKIREGGERRLHETEGAFGLTPTQLVGVHEALSGPITFSTKGQRCFDVLKRVAGGLSLPFLADAAATQAMKGNEVVADELQGLCAGTVMAAALRPLGLVLVPQKGPDGAITLEITDVRSADESWPVGWPPEQSPLETAPKLFDNLTVEINDQPLASTLDTVRGRIEIPLLYDHNSLARHRIDPSQVNVSMVRERRYYKSIIDRLLNQAQLKSELRVDEAGKPFLWISTIKR